jgi:hypothetical protein
MKKAVSLLVVVLISTFAQADCDIKHYSQYVHQGFKKKILQEVRSAAKKAAAAPNKGEAVDFINDEVQNGNLEFPKFETNFERMHVIANVGIGVNESVDAEEGTTQIYTAISLEPVYITKSGLGWYDHTGNSIFHGLFYNFKEGHHLVGKEGDVILNATGKPRTCVFRMESSIKDEHGFAIKTGEEHPPHFYVENIKQFDILVDDLSSRKEIADSVSVEVRN